MLLVDVFDQPSIVDRYTFVFDEINPGGYHTMLAMSEDGHQFSQWTSGSYDPNGVNEHLGHRIPLSAIGAVALDGFFRRLCIPDEWEDIYQTVEQVIKDGDE